MATTATLEERVTALEKAVAALQRRTPTGNNAWVNDVIGKVTDLELLDELDAIGREMRRTGRLPEEAEGSP